MSSSYYGIVFPKGEDGIPIEGKYNEEKRTFRMKKTIPLEHGTKVKVHLYKKENDFLFEVDFSFYGEFEGRVMSESEIKFIGKPMGEVESPLIHVQENADSAKEFIERFNSNVANDILEAMDQAIISIQGGKVPVLEPTKVMKQGEMLILFPSNSRRIKDHLEYNKHMKLFVPEINGVKSIEISGIAEQTDSRQIRFLPLKISYGNHTEMETFHFVHEIPKILKEELKQAISPLKFWWRVTRGHLALFGMFSVLLAVSLTISGGNYPDLRKVTLLMAMVISFLLSSNLLNDYFDSIKDEYNPFGGGLHGGSGAIQHELITREQTLLLSLILAIFGFIAAVILLIENWNLALLVLGTVAVGIAILFSAPPFKLGSRGMGEILSSLEIGLLPYVGTYIFLSKTFKVSEEFTWVGFYLVTLIFSWFLLTNLLDLIPDVRAEKQTLPTLLGQSRSIDLFKISFSTAFIIWSGILFNRLDELGSIPVLIGFGFALRGMKQIVKPLQVEQDILKPVLDAMLLQLFFLVAVFLI